MFNFEIEEDEHEDDEEEWEETKTTIFKWNNKWRFR